MNRRHMWTLIVHGHVYRKYMLLNDHFDIEHLHNYILKILLQNETRIQNSSQRASLHVFIY